MNSKQMEKQPLILWADDEIDMLKPHIMFLENHGYNLITVNNGLDAIEKAVAEPVDLVILDEHMPGISGLQTLAIIKEKIPHLPIVMITKSEEEDIMNRAIGSKIADYLIKPVNPRQILSSLKKHTQGRRLVAESSVSRYIDEFREISEMVGQCGSLSDWAELYRRLTYWQVELSGQGALAENNRQIAEMVNDQLIEAEKVFFKFINRNYRHCLEFPGLPMSPDVLPTKVVPLLEAGERPWLVIVDNFRIDQWFALRSQMSDMFRIEEETACSIIPTTTQYARNAILSGLMPAQIKNLYPDLWVAENDAEAKNIHEEELLGRFFKRNRLEVDVFYAKAGDAESCARLLNEFPTINKRKLKVLVVNFIDMLSHERTKSAAVRELSSTEAGFRSLALSWFRHSPIGELFQAIASAGTKVILTTDHGTVRVSNPVPVNGDRTTSDTLRYKVGKNLKYEGKDVMEVNRPQDIGLPSIGPSTDYLFAGATDYFVYRNNYNQFAKYYDGTYQHGGISMQEMLVPLITLIPK